MAGLGQMEHEIKRERVVDTITKRRDAGKDLGGRPRIITDSQIRSASRLIEGGEPAAQVARAAQVPSHVNDVTSFAGFSTFVTRIASPATTVGLEVFQKSCSVSSADQAVPTRSCFP